MMLLRRRAPNKSRFLTQKSKVLKSSVVSSKAVDSEVEGSMESPWCAGPDKISTMLSTILVLDLFLGQSHERLGQNESKTKIVNG